MPNDVRIAPSILAADVMHLADEIASIDNADYVHFDVMDGHFVPNLSFGLEMLEKVCAATSVPVDCHLMISNPDEYVERYARAGASMVTFHIEATPHAHRVIYAIREAGSRAGVVLCPATPISTLDAIIEDVDMVLLMSVNPGFGGQRFIEGTYRKLAQLRELCDERGVRPLIEIDGGITIDNVEDVCAAGVDVVVAGSSVFKAPNHAAAIETLRERGRLGMARRS